MLCCYGKEQKTKMKDEESESGIRVYAINVCWIKDL